MNLFDWFYEAKIVSDITNPCRREKPMISRVQGNAILIVHFLCGIEGCC